MPKILIYPTQISKEKALTASLQAEMCECRRLRTKLKESEYKISQLEENEKKYSIMNK